MELITDANDGLKDEDMATLSRPIRRFNPSHADTTQAVRFAEQRRGGRSLSGSGNASESDASLADALLDVAAFDQLVERANQTHALEDAVQAEAISKNIQNVLEDEVAKAVSEGKDESHGPRDLASNDKTHDTKSHRHRSKNQLTNTMAKSILGALHSLRHGVDAAANESKKLSAANGISQTVEHNIEESLKKFDNDVRDNSVKQDKVSDLLKDLGNIIKESAKKSSVGVAVDALAQAVERETDEIQGLKERIDALSDASNEEDDKDRTEDNQVETNQNETDGDGNGAGDDDMNDGVTHPGTSNTHHRRKHQSDEDDINTDYVPEYDEDVVDGSYEAIAAAQTRARHHSAGASHSSATDSSRDKSEEYSPDYDEEMQTDAEEQDMSALETTDKGQDTRAKQDTESGADISETTLDAVDTTDEEQETQLQQDTQEEPSQVTVDTRSDSETYPSNAAGNATSSDNKDDIEDDMASGADVQDKRNGNTASVQASSALNGVDSDDDEDDSEADEDDQNDKEQKDKSSGKRTSDDVDDSKENDEEDANDKSRDKQRTDNAKTQSKQNSQAKLPKRLDSSNGKSSRGSTSDSTGRKKTRNDDNSKDTMDDDPLNQSDSGQETRENTGTTDTDNEKDDTRSDNNIVSADDDKGQAATRQDQSMSSRHHRRKMESLDHDLSEILSYIGKGKTELKAPVRFVQMALPKIPAGTSKMASNVDIDTEAALSQIDSRSPVDTRVDFPKRTKRGTQRVTVADPQTQWHRYPVPKVQAQNHTPGQKALREDLVPLLRPQRATAHESRIEQRDSLKSRRPSPNLHNAKDYYEAKMVDKLV